jgi:predicted anti-sigma-YlaC factor YlaD
MTPPADDFPCNELVEVVTDYLEGSMTPHDARRLEEHLTLCPGCASVLEQFRLIVSIGGRVAETDVEELPDTEREALVQAFRDWSASR